MIFSIFPWYIIGFLGNVLHCEAFNYCSYAARNLLCNGSVHVVCKPTSVLTNEVLLSPIPMTNVLREIVLGVQNNFRNELAAGNITNGDEKAFVRAMAMREFIWDDHFAYIASVHASRCSEDMDQCHNTMHIRNVSQLTGSTFGTDVLGAYKVIFDKWLLPVKTLKSVLTKTYPQYSREMKVKASKPMLLFNERTSRVGCAMSYCDFLGQPKIHVTCYYENANEMDVIVYKPLEPTGTMNCSIWESEPSTKYPFLCKNTGKIFPEFYPN